MEILDLFLELWAQFLPVLLAVVAGGLVGIEREYRDKSAGFRTMILIAVGSCVFTLLAIAMGTPEKETTRIVASIVTGVGFLGAGVILKDGATVGGLTTAAAIWTVAALGALAGAGQFPLLFTVTLLVLIVLWALPPFERWLDRMHEFLEIQITIKNTDAAEDDVLDIFDELKVKIVHVRRTRQDKVERVLHIKIKTTPAKRAALSEILVNEKGILSFSA